MQSTIERLSSDALFHAQRGLSKLIGAELEITLKSASLIKKQGYLEMLSGRNSIISLTMSGVFEGQGCLVTAEKSVLRLGGKMLMLPPSELNSIISSAHYQDEKELLYAFDKIAKCLLISFLTPFQNDNALITAITCQTQEIAGDQKKIGQILSHLPDEYTYYQVSAVINLAGVPIDGFFLLLPAFVLVCSESFQKQQAKQTVQGYSDNGVQKIGQTNHFSSPLTSFFEHQKTTSGGSTTSLIPHLITPLQAELANLLGGSVQIVDKGTSVAVTTEFFRQVDSVAHLAISLSLSGPGRSQGWLIADMIDAARLGQLLALGAHGGVIPISFSHPISADCQDGYNEICAVFIDVLSFVCEELSGGELVLEKTEPINYNDVVPETDYQKSSSASGYGMSSLELTSEGRQCGRLHLLLPTFVYEYLEKVESDAAGKISATLKPELAATVKNRAAIEDSEPDSRPDSSYRVLTIEAVQGCAAEVMNTLKAGGVSGDSLCFAEEFHKTQLESYRAILIVIEKLDEIALGVVIKIKSISSVPLLAAASQWTQADVIKALRYGVDDIVMLPLNDKELVEKIIGLEPLPA